MDIWLYFMLYADKRRRDAVEKLFKSNIMAGSILHKHLDRAIMRHEVGNTCTALQGRPSSCLIRAGSRAMAQSLGPLWAALLQAALKDLFSELLRLAGALAQAGQPLCQVAGQHLYELLFTAFEMPEEPQMHRKVGCVSA